MYWVASVQQSSVKETDLEPDFEGEALEAYFSENAEMLNHDSEDWLAVTNQSLGTVFE